MRIRRVNGVATINGGRRLCRLRQLLYALRCAPRACSIYISSQRLRLRSAGSSRAYADGDVARRSRLAVINQRIKLAALLAARVYCLPWRCLMPLRAGGAPRVLYLLPRRASSQRAA